MQRTEINESIDAVNDILTSLASTHLDKRRLEDFMETENLYQKLKSINISSKEQQQIKLKIMSISEKYGKNFIQYEKKCFEKYELIGSYSKKNQEICLNKLNDLKIKESRILDSIIDFAVSTQLPNKELVKK